MTVLAGVLSGPWAAFLDGWRRGWGGVEPAPVPVLDVPAPTTHVLPAEALWWLLAEAAHLAWQGEDPPVAASLVLAGLEWEALSVEVEG